MSTTHTEILIGRGTVELTAAEGADKPATVRIRAYTGGVIRPSGWSQKTVVDLAGMKLPARVPLLLDHNNAISSIAGHGVPKVEGGELIIEGEIARDTEAGARVLALAKSGVPLAVSIGSEVISAIELHAGDTATANGKTFKAGDNGLILIVKSLLRETSFVAVGADQNAGVEKIAASKRKTNMATDSQHDTDDIEATATTHEERELERQDKIKALFARHSDVEWCEPKEDGKVIKTSTFKARAIREGWDPRDVEVQLMRATLSSTPAWEKNSPAVHIHATRDTSPGMYSQALSCAVARQLGMSNSSTLLGKNYGREHVYAEQVLELADSREIRGLTSLHALMDNVVRAASGSGFAGSRKSEEFVRAYVGAAKSLEASGGSFSTLTIANVLEDAAGKMMLDRLAMAQPVWPTITKQVPTDNFHPKKLYRADADLGLLPLAPQGQITHGKLVDSRRTVAPDTLARMISLDRVHIRNDDLGAFGEIINGLADGANWAAESLVFTVLLGNEDDFFHSNNNNLIDNVLGLEGLENAEVSFGGHTGAGGKPIAGSAQILLVGNSLSVTGRQLLAPLLLNVDANASAITQGNPHAAKYTLIKSPYMDVTSVRTPSGATIPNQSPTKWLLLSSPTVGSVVTVALLDGAMVPTIQSSETSFDTLGLSWRAYWDIGAAQGDVEYGVLSTGDESA